MKKRIVLCADDYGQAPAISQGILALVKSGRLSAVSCLVTTPYWREHAEWLKPFLPQIDVGLHFNLTEGKTSLPKLMVRAALHQIDRQAIAAELNQQIDLFMGAIGRLPDFIDGHQHVHQFPVIRDVLLGVYEKRFKNQKPYIRLVNEGLKPRDLMCDVKKVLVHVMGAKALKRLLQKHEIPHNQSFSGMYSFSKAAQYEKVFPLFLADIGEGGIVMCHPGMPASQPGDPIATARYLEYQYLSGVRFKVDCEAQGIEIGRFG